MTTEDERVEDARRRAREQIAAIERELAEERRWESLGLETYGGPGDDSARPRLIGTRLDLAQVVDTVRQNGSAEAAAAYLELPAERVRQAMAYHADHAPEIDRWIAESDQRAHDRGLIAWLEGTY